MKFLFLATMTFIALAPAATAAHRQVSMVRVSVEIDIAASPATVWANLTTGRNLVTWSPEWKSPKNAKASLKRVGDVLDYADTYGNTGKSVVTFIDRGKELRVTHEPDNGDYQCQARFVLTRGAEGTHVLLWDEYTDESDPPARDATAEKTEKELNATLAALKQVCEASRSRLQ